MSKDVLDQMPRTFVDVLADLDEGKTVEHLSAEVRRVVQAVKNTKKKGSLNLKIDISVDGSMVRLVPAITTKVPTPSAGSTMFYAGTHGDLTRNDPRQLEIKEIDQKPPELKSIPAPQAKVVELPKPAVEVKQ